MIRNEACVGLAILALLAFGGACSDSEAPSQKSGGDSGSKSSSGSGWVRSGSSSGSTVPSTSSGSGTVTPSSGKGASGQSGGESGQSGESGGVTGASGGATGESGSGTGESGSATGDSGSDAGTAGSTSGAASGASGDTNPGEFQPACASTVAKGGACGASDPPKCFKTCGPDSSGFKSETCSGGTWTEQSGCSFPADKDYACYKIPTTVSPSCPAEQPKASSPCTVDPCTPCNAGGFYQDSKGTPKSGWCVCSGTTTKKWTCGSDNAWPCLQSPLPASCQ